MFLDQRVLDVHGHVSPPMQGTGMVNMLLRATNTAGLAPSTVKLSLRSSVSTTKLGRRASGDI
jgi:hypothetical protein